MIENGKPLHADVTGTLLTFTEDIGSAGLAVKQKNRLRGITPTSSVFGTAPTTLSNVTDGDFSTVTGTGSTNAGGAGDYGILTFDMAASYTVLMGGRVGLWAASSRVVEVFLESSDDNVTWRTNAGLVGLVNASAYMTSPAGEIIADIAPVVLTGRYVRARFWVNGASNTANAKIYEMFAFDLGGV